MAQNFQYAHGYKVPVSFTSFYFNTIAKINLHRWSFFRQKYKHIERIFIQLEQYFDNV